MDITLIGKIYELNGMIKALNDVAEYDDTLNHPIIERMETKMNEIVDQIEKSCPPIVPSNAVNF